MLLFLSGKTCSQHDAWNNISFIRCYAPCGADGLIARVKRLDRTRNAPARDQTRRTRTRILRALTHEQTRSSHTHTHTYTSVRTNGSSGRHPLESDPQTPSAGFLHFSLFFFHSYSLGSIFFSTEKKILLILLL